jgi:hypothetical protein
MILLLQELYQSSGKRQIDRRKMQELNKKTSTISLFSTREANSRKLASNSNKRKSHLRLPDRDQVSSWQILTMMDPRWQAAYQCKITRNSTLCRIKSVTERSSRCLISLLKIMELCVILIHQVHLYLEVRLKDTSN